MKKLELLLITLICLMKSFGQQSEPPNTSCIIKFDKKTGSCQLLYDRAVIATITLKSLNNNFEKDVKTVIENNNEALTQTIVFSGSKLSMLGKILTSNQAIAAETRTTAQEKFPLVRTTIGNASVNRRNNAIYDRYSDWMLELNIVNGQQQIKNLIQANNKRSFSIEAAGDKITLVFRPRYYQKHKGITYFKPRSYNVWKQPVTGWSSWWAYFRNFNEKNLTNLLDVWKEKQMADFGYKYIQIDDVFQGGSDAGHNAPKNGPNGYYATGSGTWLNWKRDLFPTGLSGYVQNINKRGFVPGVWMGCFFTATDTVNKYPDWFIKDSTGKPAIGNWVTYAINTKNRQAAETLVRPIFRGWKASGMKYVKIDQLRHYLYDNMNNNSSFFKDKNYTSDDVFRRYLSIAREELGKETFILSCWGVLPQSVGLVDACRIGGDGYGPVTMQQYNSWNGIVWINDPDHCDVYPNYKPAETGNVKSVSAAAANLAVTRLRPSLASVAGCMLILSDKPDVYKKDENLDGIRRASPVLFSVPGQLYDYDDKKTKVLPGLNVANIESGANPTIIDADQYGTVCPWWLNEINRSFESWNVLSHMNWTKETLLESRVSFADLGLDDSKEYLVFEFWNKEFLGVYKKEFAVKALQPDEINTYSIRDKVNHPQILSTNRHLTQGGYDLLNVNWGDNSLTGKSKVVKNDRYELYVYLPKGYSIQSAIADNKKMQVVTKENYAIVSMLPGNTKEIGWEISFKK